MTYLSSTTEDDHAVYLTPLGGVIYNDDVEEFVQFAELAAKLPNLLAPTELGSKDQIVSKNRVKPLDEYSTHQPGY